MEPLTTGAMSVLSDRREVVLEILFHPDWRRIGDTHVLGPASADQSRAVGRILPLWSRADTARAEPVSLEDPCISRQQLQVDWSATDRSFSVADQSGRGGIRVLDACARALPDGPRFPAGSMIAVGQRLLLLCTTRLLDSEPDFGLVGQSEEMIALRGQMRRMARVPEALLIRGEPGTGKELVARGVHLASDRRDAPYVPLNCAALPETMIEDELFGHARGAFTGASGAREGLFASARGGTIFLDEIGDMPLSAQTRLLRVLQENTIRPVGTSAEVKVNVRVVAATNRDLKSDVASGRFRADLFTRLAGLEIEVPPLRARRSDVPLLLATFFLKRATGASTARLQRFIQEASASHPPIPLDLVLSSLRHDWPGNVRELERFVAAIDASTDEVGPLVVPPSSLKGDAHPPSGDAHRGETVEVSRRHGPPPLPSSTEVPIRREPSRLRPDAAELTRLFDEHDFVVQRVAEALGTTRPTVARWAREIGLVLPQDLSSETITETLDEVDGDLVKAARALRVGLRGLKLRMKELGR